MNWFELYHVGECIYENPFADENDVRQFRMEGDGAITFPLGRMRMESKRSPSQGQNANFVYWCDKDFPPDIAITWEFWPLREPGLCILFFSATGMGGEDLFDPSLKTRTGPYEEYHHGDINAYHVSYFRRMYAEERALHTCNLRKSYGFHLVAQGADPIPDVNDCCSPYHIALVKCGGEIRFFINELEVFYFHDDNHTYGSVLGGGKIGFRQMAPLIAEYANMRVFEVRKK